MVRTKGPKYHGNNDLQRWYILLLVYYAQNLLFSLKGTMAVSQIQKCER